jgi:murein L,D-transpeptidase YcbB/YkuD
MRVAPAIVGLVGLLVVPSSALAVATPTPAATDATSIRGLVQAGKLADLTWPAFGDVRADLEQVYAGRAWAPLWLVGRGPTPAAKAMVTRLAGADSLGFDPEDFDAGWLTRTAEGMGMRRANPSPDDLARFEVTLSVAAARFLSALDVGRVAPKSTSADVHLPTPARTPELTIDALRDEAQQAETLRRAQPPFRHYQLLKNALVQYRKLALDPTLNTGLGLPRDLRPGQPLPGAARLRKLLEATGDLGKHQSPRPKTDTVYSPELVEAVKRFQARHGQLPDGILFVQTLRELERPFSDRVRQIELALERWRWLPDNFAAPPILVNVAAFRLHAYRSLDPGSNDVLDMDVLVGAADKSETPVFAADMKYLIFRPWWEMPAEIMNNELGPRAQWDWENLHKLGYVLMSTRDNDRRIVPLTEQNVNRIGKGMRMRQRPGEMNALGLVKFMLPNPYDIYLHDTPAKGLFEFPRRDMSHGCIRVSDPPALAALVLRGQDGWIQERVDQAMQGEDDVRVDLAQPVPVYVLYITSEASPDGAVSFYSDIYGQDEALDAMLKRGYPYPARYTPAKKDAQGRISTRVPTGTTR